MKIALPVCAALVLAACDWGPREVAIPPPNTLTPATAGHIEQTKYADKVVTSNWTKDALGNCVAVVGAHRARLGELQAGATVTVMRTRFEPYIEADAFLAEKDRRIECDAPSGRMRVTFPDMGTFTAPADALKQR